MTPMIDVVFLLVIFFLVSSHLAQRESLVALDLPDASTGQRDSDPSPRLTVHVEAGGALALGAEAVTPAELAETLAARRDERGEPPRVRLRCDRAAPYGAVEPALAACVAAGVEDLALAVREAETPR